jgi:RNA polymerase sigma-70 factor (ECF subfamily)
LEPSDADLLRLAGRGDDRAFHALVDRYADPLFQAAMSLSRNAADAEDLVQETFVSAYRAAHGFAGRASVRTWLLTILTHHAARAWRRGRRRRETRSLDAPPGGQMSDDPALATPPQNAQVDHRLDVATILAELSAMHREVLIMREIWGMTYDEIARALGVPRGTVESRLSRARAQFRLRFDPPEEAVG